MKKPPQDPYDLSHLVEDPDLKAQFRTQAWRQMVEVRMEFAHETQEQAAAYMVRTYNGGTDLQADAVATEGPQMS